MLPRPYVGSYSGKKGHQFFHKPWILALAKSVETFIMVLISEIPTINYWKIWEVLWIKQKRLFQKNVELVIHVSSHLQLLEVIYTQDIRRILIMYKHKLVWRSQYFNSSDVSMLVHDCGVSQYPQFYDTIKIYQMLPHPDVGSYSGETLTNFLQTMDSCISQIS